MDKSVLQVTIPVACPKCNATSVILQLLTSYGSYCRCDTCAHLWHQDRPFNDERGTAGATT